MRQPKEWGTSGTGRFYLSEQVPVLIFPNMVKSEHHGLLLSPAHVTDENAPDVPKASYEHIVIWAFAPNRPIVSVLELCPRLLYCLRGDSVRVESPTDPCNNVE